MWAEPSRSTASGSSRSGPTRTTSFRTATSAPRATAIADVHDDPDRLRQPMRRTPAGDFEPISLGGGLRARRRAARGDPREHGGDAVGFYLGNPIVHNHGVLALRNGVIRALGTRNCTSAGSQDTSPRFAASYYLYGSSLSIPMPDIDRTDYLLCVGANPRVSQGQLHDGARHPQAAAGHSPARRPRGRGRSAPHRDGPRSRRARGDPARRRRGLPAGDGAGDRRRRPRRSRERRSRWPAAGAKSNRAWLRSRPSAWRPAWASRPKRFAGWPASSPPRKRRVAYSRVGVCNNAHGTVASLATDLLNLVAGRVGEVGGAMFPTPVVRRHADSQAHQGRRPRPLAQPRARAARDARRSAGLDPGRRDRNARRRPGARHGHLRRQPGALDAQRPAACRRPWRGWSSWSRSTCTSTRRRDTPT